MTYLLLKSGPTIAGLLPKWYSSMDEKQQEEEESVLCQRRLPTGQVLTLMSRSFHGATIGIGPRPPFHRVGVFDDTWDYTRRDIALMAFHHWYPDETKEPMGWTRHITSGRYRIGGDPTMEYIKLDIDDARARADAAVLITRGKSRIIVEEQSEEIFLHQEHTPEGTRCFLIASLLPDCPHTPPCCWRDTVFQYQDRTVVWELTDLILRGRRELIECLTRQDL